MELENKLLQLCCISGATLGSNFDASAVHHTSSPALSWLYWPPASYGNLAWYKVTISWMATAPALDIDRCFTHSVQQFWTVLKSPWTAAACGRETWRSLWTPCRLTWHIFLLWLLTFISRHRRSACAKSLITLLPQCVVCLLHWKKSQHYSGLWPVFF